jgi:signal transduction histidine kinase
MANLAHWLEQNKSTLIQATVVELSQDEALRLQALKSVELFFDNLIQSAEIGDPAPLESVLFNWVEARSVPTQDDPTGGIVAAVAILKRVTWGQIRRHAADDEKIDLLTAADDIFTQALIRLSKLESAALLFDLGRQLDEAQAYVKYVDKRKADFISIAAHELKTPLTLIEGYADILRQSDKLMPDAQASELLEGIKSGIARLREITQDMIDVSLINLKLMQPRFQPVLLNHILNVVESQTEEMLQQRQLKFSIERSAVPRKFTYADPKRLLQAIQKVVMNAVKYTPDGGQVTICARELPNFTDLMVMDTGIGIEPTKLPLIFDLFSSQSEVALHSSGKTKFKGGGPGLGLAIAKGIIESHGGNIWAESPGYDEEKCPGSTFHIMIPMYTAEPKTLD